MPRKRPSVFIGSSSEGLKFAKAIQMLLDHASEVTIWSQGIFGLSEGTLESLVSAAEQFDFAVLVLTPDDLVESRGLTGTAPRDNVLFELGLFMGSLGRQRTFVVYDRTADIRLPSDLAGVTSATFEPHSSGRLESALGAATTRIEDRIERLGVREAERLRAFSAAATDFGSASSTMQELIELLARSRKVELEIIAAQFGPFIEPSKLDQVRQDLTDLEKLLLRARGKSSSK